MKFHFSYWLNLLMHICVKRKTRVVFLFFKFPVYIVVYKNTVNSVEDANVNVIVLLIF